MVSLLIIPCLGYGQISLNAENMALGGGGTAYLTGYESLFVNPANLYILEKSYSYQVSILQGGIYLDTLFPVNNQNRFQHYRNISSSFNFSEPSRPLSEVERRNLIARNFSNSRSITTNQTQSDFYWFGLKWNKPDKSYALALRTRVGNRFQIHRGQFISEPIQDNGTSIVDQSFNQQYQVLHELSFGYAESFTFLNGLIPQLSEFIVGIAPKVILSGAYLDIEHTNRFKSENENAAWIQENNMAQKTAGPLSDTSQLFFEEFSTERMSGKQTSFRDLMNPTGIGFGLDLGITYLITFGDDLSVLNGQDALTERSLRLSFSVTDIGAIHYFDSPLSYESNTIIRETETIDPVSDFPFSGSPNEHYLFLNHNGNFIESSRINKNTDSFSALLPASIQTGALFQINRIKLMGDISLAFTDSAFQKNGFLTYLGAEVRPLSFLPLRAGTRLSTSLPGLYSFGTGVETKRFDLNIAIQLRTDNAGITSEMVGASVMGLKIYLQ